MADKKNDTFREAIAICTRDGKVKMLEEDKIASLPNLPDALRPVVDTLLQRGVVVAAVPSNPGIGYACYLINLASIVRPGTDE